MTKAENLSFLSIRLKNYRQFYGDSGKISLEPKNGKRINIIQGENGWGKSNILNAINYCLYLEEPHLKPESETMTFLNTKAIGETKEGEQIEMIIELELGNEQRKYRIDRKITTTKGKLSEKIDPSSGDPVVDVQRVQKLNALLPVGVEYDLMETSFKFADKGRDWQDRNFAAGVDNLLPSGLRPFFFLDGEFLESLNTTFEGIEMGVKEIAHISLIENAATHLPKVLKKYEKKTVGQNAVQDDWLKKKDRHENWLESLDQDGNPRDNEEDPLLQIFKDEKVEGYHSFSGKPRKLSKEKERVKIRTRLEQINGLLQKDNSELISGWGDDLEEIIKEMPKLEDDLAKKKDEKLAYIIEFSPQVFLHDCIKLTCDLVDKKRILGKLPVRYNDFMYEDLLKVGKCICGTNLSDETARENIEKWHSGEKEDAKLDEAVGASADFKALLKLLPKEIGKIDEYRRQISGFEERITKFRDKKKEIELNLKGIDREEIKVLREESTAKENMKNALDLEIAKLESEITSRKLERNLAQNEYNKMVRADKKMGEATDKLEICQNLLNNFRKVVETVTTKLRDEVGETTKNNFKDLIGKTLAFTNVTLNEDYRLTVFAKGEGGLNWDVTGNLSAGEKLCLALAYIAAIKGMTGYQMPLIIDTPLGKIAGRPKTFIGQRLPNFLSNTQLTLLVTDTEYQSPIVDRDDPNKLNDSFRKVIKKDVNIEYTLDYDEKGKSTSFKPMPMVK